MIWTDPKYRPALDALLPIEFHVANLWVPDRPYAFRIAFSYDELWIERGNHKLDLWTPDQKCPIAVANAKINEAAMRWLNDREWELHQWATTASGQSPTKVALARTWPEMLAEAMLKELEGKE